MSIKNKTHGIQLWTPCCNPNNNPSYIKISNTHQFILLIKHEQGMKILNLPCATTSNKHYNLTCTSSSSFPLTFKSIHHLVS